MADPTSLEKLLDTLPTDVAARVRALLPSARLTAARAQLQRFQAKMRLGSLGTGTWQGKNITGEEIHIHMKAESVAFEDSQVQLHVDVALGFQVPSLRKPKVYKLGPVHESVSTPKLPRINISSLAEELSATFTLSSVKADEVTADVAPILDVDAGTAFVEGIDVQGFVAPHGGFSVGGMHVGDTTVKDAGLEEARASGSHAARVGIRTTAQASDVVLQGATIVNGRATAAGKDLDLGFEVQLPALTIKTFPSMPSAIDRLVTRLSVRIEPKVVFQIGKLKLEGMTLTTRVGTLRIGALSVPVDVTGVQLDDIRMDGMRVEEVEVGRSQVVGPAASHPSARK
jgi:hypothetical protein